MNTHYTYYILGIAENIWKDRWYIGSRTATHGRTPEEDIGIRYFTTSSNDDFVAQFKAHPEWFVCTILERGYPDVRTMQDDEERRITESWNVTGRINRKARLPLFERDERYQETMRTMRESLKYRETRRKIHESPELKAKMTTTNRKIHESPEYKANHAAAMHKRSQDPEWRAKTAAVNRKLALDPEFGKKISEGKKRARAARVKSLFS